MFSVYSISLAADIYLLLNHYANNSELSTSQLKNELKQCYVYYFGKCKLRLYLKDIKAVCVGKV